jgi:hypothetical protein
MPLISPLELQGLYLICNVSFHSYATMYSSCSYVSAYSAATIFRVSKAGGGCGQIRTGNKDGWVWSMVGAWCYPMKRDPMFVAEKKWNHSLLSVYPSSQLRMWEVFHYFSGFSDNVLTVSVDLCYGFNLIKLSATFGITDFLDFTHPSVF